MKYLLKTFFFLLVTGGMLSAGEPDLVHYVNTLQGTNSNWDFSYGNTYPTVALPFPVHSFSAQTGKNGNGWKYQYEAKTIRGFQQVHQCSPWVNDYATFSLMPVLGKLLLNEEERASSFHHSNEIARPDYYKVKFDNGMVAEMTPCERSGYMRFSFPGGKEANLVLDGYTGLSEVTILPESHRIVGWVHNGLLIPQEFKCFFVLEFDQPFEKFGTWENQKGSSQPGQKNSQGKGTGAWIQFKPGTRVQVKIASSYISPEQAQLTMNQEVGKYRSFVQTREAATATWNALLNRVRVEGDSEADKATFYSCLFRASLFSHKFYEIGPDGKPCYFSPYDAKVHQGYMFTDNGFWDTFRAQFPLSNILHPEMEGRYMQSLLDAQEQCGWFPTWSCPGMSGIMIGNHAISLLTDAWAKGIRGFDPEKALAAYYHEVTNKGPFGGSNGREGAADYFQLGYIPHPEIGESAAKTLEYAYDDFCAYHLACMTGNTFYQEVFARQMYNYRNVWDSSVGFMRGRQRDGKWAPNFSPIAWGSPFTEGNPWQYSWSVFHDVQGLIELMGGEKKFVQKLDTFFNMSTAYEVGSYGTVIHEMREMALAQMGQYAHGNQPVQHVGYLYNYAGAPWKTQYRIREVMRKLYNATENGFPGDEDQGGMSSWFVLSAMGIYSVCPGTDQYVLGSPLFRKISIQLENGKVFVIEAPHNNAENVYIQSAQLNGRDYGHNWISYQDIQAGGKLTLEMSSQPNTNRGTLPEDRPFSVSNKVVK